MAKQLKVQIVALCEVPDEFRLTPTNYGSFELSHRDDDGTIRRLLIDGAQIHLKEPKQSKRKSQEALIA